MSIAIYRWRIGSAALLLLALLGVRVAHCADPILYRSERSFDDTVQQLQWAFGGYGLTTVMALDYQQILKTIKVSAGRAVIFEVMRREWLKILLNEDPALGLAMPVRIYVFESGDATTLVGCQSLEAALQTHPKETVRAFGRQLDERLSALVTQATRLPSSNR
jgi:uncharacterized protein (DUF302 family)